MYYFRVVAVGNKWQCKRGPKVLHVFDCVGEALALAEMEAAVYRPSEVSVHGNDGRVEIVSRYAAFE